jgi:hypothetical protein
LFSVHLIGGNVNIMLAARTGSVVAKTHFERRACFSLISK